MPASPALRLLIADDAPYVRAVLERLLGAAGHDCRMVSGGEAALAAAGETRFDAIVADLHMADLDGDDLIGLLRTGRGPNRTTPVLLVSGDADAAAAAGADAVVGKPIDPAALLATLARVVSAAAGRPA